MSDKEHLGYFVRVTLVSSDNKVIGEALIENRKIEHLEHYNANADNFFVNLVSGKCHRIDKESYNVLTQMMDIT